MNTDKFVNGTFTTEDGRAFKLTVEQLKQLYQQQRAEEQRVIKKAQMRNKRRK